MFNYELRSQKEENDRFGSFFFLIAVLDAIILERNFSLQLSISKVIIENNSDYY